MVKQLNSIRRICACDKCSSRYKRVNTWGTREKWMCSSGCGCSSYIDDTALENAITTVFNIVINQPEKLDVIINSQYKPTNEVLRQENEMIRLSEQHDLSFSTIAKIIMHGATVRFGCCEYDKGEITEKLKKDVSALKSVEHIDCKMIKKYIKQVRVTPHGEIIVVFINNAEITMNGGTENAGQLGKDSN